MPLIKLETSADLSDEKKASLLPQLSRIIAEEIGKPEVYVMVTIEQNQMLMSGSDSAAAFADVRSIGGLTADINQAISKRLCSLLDQELGVSIDRTYINFTDIPRTHWGWNSRTFG